MDKFKRYYGVVIFIASVVLLIFISCMLIIPKLETLQSVSSQVEEKNGILESKRSEKSILEGNIKKLRNSIAGSQKKVYSPVESDLGNDTLFFTLYNDVIEMIHSNLIKIKSINYTYNPQSDEFVKFGKDVYFVCDVDMELVSNYTNLGKLIQDIYQYPYYIKINQLDVKPYEKDKKVLLSSLSLRLYAHTAPEEDSALNSIGTTESNENNNSELPEIQ